MSWAATSTWELSSRYNTNGVCPSSSLTAGRRGGVSDATLATDGVPIQVHSDAPYENLNNKITFRIPVAQRAVFTYMHCVGIGKPVMQRSSTLDEFARLGDPERVVLLSLDPTARVVRAENDPAC